MNLSECLMVALEGLKANKIRSALTMLGVVIGVGAVIAMIAIGQGAQEQTLAVIQSMGTNVLSIIAGQARTGVVMGGMGSNSTLTYQDALAIQKKCPMVAGMSPEVRSNSQVTYKNMNTSTTIQGTSPDYLSIRNYQIDRGRYFNDKDEKAMSRVCVLGTTVITNLFGRSDPMGQVIRIKGINFKVVGVTKSKGSNGMQDQDDIIFIPATTAMKRVFGIIYVRSISAQCSRRADMDTAITEIQAVLRKRHKLQPNAPDDFMIRNQADIMETADQTSKTFTMLLAGIAAVSLLVGGIGIMNIMLVSVTERTREIGIRKAVGAKRRDILLQFLIESLVLSLLGGLMGIIVGTACAIILSNTAGWKISISLPAVLLSFFFSAAVGIFFGIYPARKASSLRPIDALRYE
jgi:putative ABC transport system permease protein